MTSWAEISRNVYRRTAFSRFVSTLLTFLHNEVCVLYDIKRETSDSTCLMNAAKEKRVALEKYKLLSHLLRGAREHSV